MTSCCSCGLIRTDELAGQLMRELREGGGGGEGGGGVIWEYGRGVIKGWLLGWGGGGREGRER